MLASAWEIESCPIWGLFELLESSVDEWPADSEVFDLESPSWKLESTTKRGLSGGCHPLGLSQIFSDGSNASALRLRWPRNSKEAMTAQILIANDFVDPAILLCGEVGYPMYESFREQLAAAPKDGLVVLELSTLGGDPEVARMMGEDVRFHSDLAPGRRFAFLGKAAIYSAGTTLMSFFAPENRYLTRGTRLMVHERKLSKQLAIDGPLTTCIATVKATLHEIEASIAIQNEGFKNLINGSTVTMDEVLEKAPANWYIEATEAQQRGLVAAVI